MTDQTTLKLAVILGSARKGRFGPVVAHWFLGEAEEHGAFEIDHIDLAEIDLPAELPPDPAELMTVDGRPPHMQELAARLDEADAYVIVTPEYNHSYPAVLKHFIDWHYVQWRAKPIGFVSYGGTGGGLRAVEHLRQVFGEMHAVDVRDYISFDRPWELFDQEGRPKDPNGPSGAAKVLLDQLTWWATALSNARRTNPYQATV